MTISRIQTKHVKNDTFTNRSTVYLNLEIFGDQNQKTPELFNTRHLDEVMIFISSTSVDPLSLTQNGF